MARFILVHSHRPVECGVAFAAWRGFASPLRHATTAGSCAAIPVDADVHRIWWTVEAANEDAAFAQLPPWIAERTSAEAVGEVAIP